MTERLITWLEAVKEKLLLQVTEPALTQVGKVLIHCPADTEFWLNRDAQGLKRTRCRACVVVWQFINSGMPRSDPTDGRTKFSGKYAPRRRTENAGYPRLANVFRNLQHHILELRGE